MLGLLAILVAPASAEDGDTRAQEVRFGAPTDIAALPFGSSLGGNFSPPPPPTVSDAFGASTGVAVSADGSAIDYVQASPFDMLAAESYQSKSPESLLPHYDAMGRRAKYELAADNSLSRDGDLELRSTNANGDGTPSELAYYATAGEGAIMALKNGFMIESAAPQGTGASPVGSRVALVAAPTPEPATWLTMILGFGAVGIAMRRRHPHRAPSQGVNTDG